MASLLLQVGGSHPEVHVDSLPIGDCSPGYTGACAGVGVVEGRLSGYGHVLLDIPTVAWAGGHAAGTT